MYDITFRRNWYYWANVIFFSNAFTVVKCLQRNVADSQLILAISIVIQCQCLRSKTYTFVVKNKTIVVWNNELKTISIRSNYIVFSPYFNFENFHVFVFLNITELHITLAFLAPIIGHRYTIICCYHSLLLHPLGG